MLEGYTFGTTGPIKEPELTRAAVLRENALVLLVQEPHPSRPKDIKRFYTDIKEKGNSAQLSACCMFCRKTMTSTGATRRVDHLIECVVAVREVKDLCKQLRQKTAAKRTAKDAELNMQRMEADFMEEVEKMQKVEQRQQGIRAGFQLAECTLADKAVAKFFFANGIPFHCAGNGEANSYFRQMCDAIRKTPPGWVPPHRKKIGDGPLIDTCHDDVMTFFQKREEEGRFAEKFGYSYSSDGWDSVDHLPLINSAYVICAGTGTVYLRSVDTSGATKDAEYVACLMIEDIYRLGCTNVITVVV